MDDSKLQFMNMFDDIMKNSKPKTPEQPRIHDTNITFQRAPRTSVVNPPKISPYRSQMNNRANIASSSSNFRRTNMSSSNRRPGNIADIDEDDSSGTGSDVYEDESPGKSSSSLDDSGEQEMPSFDHVEEHESSIVDEVPVDNDCHVDDHRSSSSSPTPPFVSSTPARSSTLNIITSPMLDVDVSPITSNWGEALQRRPSMQSSSKTTSSSSSSAKHHHTSSSKKEHHQQEPSYSSASQLLFASMDRDPELKRMVRSGASALDTPLSPLSLPPTPSPQNSIAPVTLKVLKRKVIGVTLDRGEAKKSLSPRSSSTAAATMTASATIQDKAKPNWIPGNYGNNDIVSNLLTPIRPQTRSATAEREQRSSIIRHHHDDNNVVDDGHIDDHVAKEYDLSSYGESMSPIPLADDHDDKMIMEELEQVDDEVTTTNQVDADRERMTSPSSIAEELHHQHTEDDIDADESTTHEADIEHDVDGDVDIYIESKLPTNTSSTSSASQHMERRLSSSSPSNKRSSPTFYPRETEATRLRNLQIADRYDIAYQAEPKNKPRAGTTYYQPRKSTSPSVSSPSVSPSPRNNDDDDDKIIHRGDSMYDMDADIITEKLVRSDDVYVPSESKSHNQGMNGPYEYKAHTSHKPSSSSPATVILNRSKASPNPLQHRHRNAATTRTPTSSRLLSPSSTLSSPRTPAESRMSQQQHQQYKQKKSNSYLSKSAPSKLSSPSAVPSNRPFTMKRLEYNNMDDNRDSSTSPTPHQAPIPQQQRQPQKIMSQQPQQHHRHQQQPSYDSPKTTHSTANSNHPDPMTRSPGMGTHTSSNHTRSKSNYSTSPTRYPPLTAHNLHVSSQSASYDKSFFQALEQSKGRKVSPGGFGMRSTSVERRDDHHHDDNDGNMNRQHHKVDVHHIDDIVRQELMHFEARIAQRLSSSSPILENRYRNRHPRPSSSHHQHHHPQHQHHHQHHDNNHHHQQHHQLVDEHQTTETAEWHRLTKWLYMINMGKYAKVFKSHGITKLSVVELLQEHDLEEIIAEADDIHMILNHIHVFSDKTKELSEQALHGHIPDTSAASSSSALTKNISRRLHDSIKKVLSSSSSSNVHHHHVDDTNAHIISSKDSVVNHIIGIDNDVDDVSLHYDNIYQSSSLSSSLKTMPVPDDDIIIALPQHMPSSSPTSLYQLFLDAYDAGDMKQFFYHWNRSKLGTGLILSSTSSSSQAHHMINYASPSIQATISIEFYLMIYFLIYSIQHHHQHHHNNNILSKQQIIIIFRQFIDHISSAASSSSSPIIIQLLQSNDFSMYSSLVFIPSPQDNISYQHLFKDEWKHNMRMRLDKFLGVMLSIASPAKSTQQHHTHDDAHHDVDHHHIAASPVKQAILQLNLSSASRHNSIIMPRSSSFSSSTPRSSIIVSRTPDIITPQQPSSSLLSSASSFLSSSSSQLVALTSQGAGVPKFSALPPAKRRNKTSNVSTPTSSSQLQHHQQLPQHLIPHHQPQPQPHLIQPQQKLQIHTSSLTAAGFAAYMSPQPDTPTSTTSTLTDRDFNTNSHMNINTHHSATGNNKSKHMNASSYDNPMRKSNGQVNTKVRNGNGKIMTGATTNKMVHDGHMTMNNAANSYHIQHHSNGQPMTVDEMMVSPQPQSKSQSHQTGNQQQHSSMIPKLKMRAASTPIQGTIKYAPPRHSMKDQVAGYKKQLKLGMKTMGGMEGVM